jgi:nucleotide-binding universal stress UspA family protein
VLKEGIMTSPSILERAVSLLVAPTPEPLLREILFPSDLSPAADAALGHARLLAERFHALLVLYHAVEVERGGEGQGVGDPARERARRRERRAHEHLLTQAERVQTRRDVRVEPAATAASAVAALVHTMRPDLTVMATHGRRGLSHLVLGSVTEAVLEQNNGPVLCVRQPEHGVALPYRRVLVPTDLTDDSRRVFPLAAAIARAFSAEVLAVHVPAVLMGRTTAGVTDAVEDAVPSEQALAAFLMPEFLGVRVVPRIFFGATWASILHAARDERVDVIAMSTHRRNSLADRVLGTHAEHVVREAPCPVLVV